MCYSVEIADVLIATGLFNPGEIPNPTHENWLKNMELWESPARGTKYVSDNNDW
jgi:hypothetical protein